MPSHAGFVAAAYIVTAVVLLAAVLAVTLDGRAVRRALRRIESSGRSEP